MVSPPDETSPPFTPDTVAHLADRTLGDLIPGLAFLLGGPDRAKMPTWYRHPVGRDLPPTWKEVARLTVRDLLDKEFVGVGKTAAFLNDVSAMVRSPAGTDLGPEFMLVMDQIVERARVEGLSDMATALRWALDHDPDA